MSKMTRFMGGATFATILLLGGNALPVQAAGLTSTQISAIVSLLQSFGADSSTIANVETSLGGSPSPSSTSSSSGASCISLSHNLYSGVTDATTGGEVTELQQFLGISPTTGYFGPSTLQTVKSWQASHGVVSSGSPSTTGYGFVGSVTRAAMACSSGTTSSTSNTSISSNPATNSPVSTPTTNPAWGPVTLPPDCHFNYGAFNPVVNTVIPPTTGQQGTPACPAGYTYTWAIAGVDRCGGCLFNLPNPIVLSDATWVNYPLKTPPSTWTNVGFNDSSWQYSADEGGFGTKPWASVDGFPLGTAARWIWYYGSNDSTAQGDTTVYFRKTFTPTVSSAILSVVADNVFTAYINGVQVSTGTGWSAQPVKVTLNPNITNVIAVKVTNTGAAGGLVVDLR